MPSTVLTATIKLKAPISGHWNNGAKDTFNLMLGDVYKDEKGEFQRVDCYEGNTYFHVAKGKSDKLTFSYAIRRMFDRKNIASITYGYETI